MSYEDIYNYSDEKIELSNIKHPDMTLEELQTMTRKKAIRLFRRWPTKDVIARNQLLMSIIMAASRIKWSTDDPRGIREFWYNPCKPIFLRVYGKEIDDLSEENIDSICDSLSHILSVMRKSQLIKYEDLGIKDFRTLRMLWEHEDRANCWSNVILFVEKDAAYIHLRPLKELLNISLLSGGGVSKTAANEDLMNILPKGKYTIFTFTDYDPWGFFISGEAYIKLKQMGWDLNVIRLGLDTEQVSKEIIAHQKYPVKMDHNGQVWSPKYGILGRLRTVFRTRKATIRDPETGKKKKVDERYLAYEGRKGWGLEIEAVSGQQGGAQALREIVLSTMLKHLKEEDRLDEIKTPLWKEIGWDEETNPFSEDEWKNYEKYGLTDFDKTITEKTYDELKKGRDAAWKEEREPVVDWATRVMKENSTLELTRNELSRQVRRTINTTHDLATRYLDEQIEELLRKKRAIKSKIENTSFRWEKTMLDWMSFHRLNLRILEQTYDEELEEIDDSHSDDIEELKEQKAITDSLRISVYVDWFDKVLEELFASKTNEEEELSFGLMPGKWVRDEDRDEDEYIPGVHMEILKEGGNVSALFSKATEFDQDRIYEYIWDVSQNAEKENIIKGMVEMMRLYGDDDRREEWDEKWNQYLEVNR